MSVKASFIAGELHCCIRTFCHTNRVGFVFPGSARFKCFPDTPAKIRRVDVSFIRMAKLNSKDINEEEFLPIPPDLAVRVVSPDDLVYELDQNILEFLSAGTQLFWVLSPKMRTVHIHHSDGTINYLEGPDELTGEDVLPGFRCRISELFVPPGA